LNNNTIKYSDKSTQTAAECEDCESSQQKPATTNKDELTQTDFPNLKESLSIHDCLSTIPYADCTNSPPPPPPVPYRRINDKKVVENCTENHQDDNHAEANELSARNLQFSIDTSIGAATQTALAAVAGSVCDNGDIQCKITENGNGANL
jgi:hypothetical protein